VSATVAVSRAGDATSAASSSSDSAGPPELSWWVRTDSSCSRGTSAAVARAIVIRVPACRRKSSRLPPNAAASAWRRCLAAYS